MSRACHPRPWLLRLASAALLGLPALAAPPDEAEGVALTIYSKAQPGAIAPELYQPAYGAYNGRGYQAVPGYAIVKQQRRMELPSGRGEVRFRDVAALIDPTTVTFTSLSDAGSTNVLEQNFQFDLVSREKLLERFLDRPVTLRYFLDDGTIHAVDGTLLAAGGTLIVNTGEQGKPIRIMQEMPAEVALSELPGGLITQPTLVWLVDAEQGGQQLVRVTYETQGMTWWADYNVTFNPGETANAGTIDLAAWVSIINQSGATYPEAKLKLIAGDVQRVEPQATARYRGGMERMAMAAPADKGFEEKAFFEYHLYTLGRPTTLPNNSTKQLELFPQARNVPVTKKFVYAGQPTGWFGGVNTNRDLGTPTNKDVDVYIELVNTEDQGLGMPLPAGRVRVNQLDSADGTLEFIGEDTIDHTPRGEKVRLRLGSAFDVVGEHKQTDFQLSSRERWMTESFEIRIRNQKKDVPVDVIVKESLSRSGNWQITNSSHDYDKQDAFTVHFPVTVPPDEEVVVTYTVRYSW